MIRATLVALTLLTCIGCSSTGSGRSLHTVTQANENAISIRSMMPNNILGDKGTALAMEHCAKYGKVASLDSNMISNNLVGSRTFVCK